VGAPHESEAGYAHAKRSMLAQLDAYRTQYGLEFAFAVSTNLFGPNDRYDEARGHVLPSLMSKFHRGVTLGQSVTVWGSGTATRDFLYSRDAAEALKTLLERGDGVYNVASGNHVTIKELVDELVAVTGFGGEVAWDRTKPDGQAARGYDITKLAALGWAPQTTLRDALAETWEWYRENAEHVRH
jgi:GDP-L-fucose synthase